MLYFRQIIVLVIVKVLFLNSMAYAQSTVQQATEIANGTNNQVESFPTRENLAQFTESEKENLREGGLSDETIEKTNRGDAQVALDHINAKKDEAIEVVTKEAIPGLGASIISTAFATFLGITLIKHCRSQPSALAFSGTSALWVVSELANWNGYKIKVENIDKLGKLNSDELSVQRQLMLKIRELARKAKALQGELSEDRDILSSISNLEDLEQFKNNKNILKIKTLVTDVVQLRHDINELKEKYEIIFDRQYNSYKQVIKSLNQIQETTEKKAKNTKIAAAGFALSSALAFAEQFNIIKGNGACFAQNDSFKLLDFFISRAYAQGNVYDGKTLKIEEGLANLDKIGILAGAGLGAAYVGFKMKFLNKILSSGLARGIIFGAMAGVAFLSSQKLQKFAKYLEEKINEIESLRTAISERLNRVSNTADNIINFMGYVETKVLPFIENKLKNIPTEDQAALIEEAKEEVLNEQMSYLKTSFEQVVSLFIPNLHANKGLESQCFVRTKDFFLIDKDCKCRKRNQCLSYEINDFSIPNSKFSLFLSKQTRDFMNNANGYFYGHQNVALKNLTQFSDKKEKILQLRSHILKTNNQNSDQVKNAIEREISSIMKSIPEESLKNYSVPLEAPSKKSPTIFKGFDDDKSTTKVLNEESIYSDQVINSQDVKVKPKVKYKINDVHKNKKLDLFKIISKRYNSKFLYN